jgi:hypothetical protein
VTFSYGDKLNEHLHYHDELKSFVLPQTTIDNIKVLIEIAGFVIKMALRSIEERGLLNASQFGFSACQSTIIDVDFLPSTATLNFL